MAIRVPALAGLALLCVWSAGCQTPERGTLPQQPAVVAPPTPTPMPTPTLVPTPKPMPADVEPARPDRGAAPAPLPAEMVKSLLAVELVARSEDEASAITTDETLRNLRSALAEDKYKLTDADGDLVLALTVRAAPFDQTGNYFVYEGEAAASVRAAALDRVLGEKRFSARAQRQLGADKAQRALGQALADAIAPWARESLLRISAELTVNDLVVRLPGGFADQEQFAGQLLAAVQGLDGVSGARLLPVTRKEREIAVRVVYYPAQMPAGLLHTLIIGHPELNLKLP